MTKEIKQTKDIQTVIDELAIKGVEALNEMADFTQEQVDHIVHHAAIAALDKHMYLAKLAVDETGLVIFDAIPNIFRSIHIFYSFVFINTTTCFVNSQLYLPSTHQLKNHQQKLRALFVMLLLKLVHLRTVFSGLKSHLSKRLVS